MKKLFYPKLAVTGMLKNKKLYVPYILTCIGMVMMCYIMGALAEVDFLGRESNSLSTIMMLGSWVVAIFSAIFLFYTNSFLMRRRKKEFGLYNILGMDKRSISRILFWETLFLFVIAVVIGLTLGILFGKFAELVMNNMMDSGIDYGFRVSVRAIRMVLMIFGAIFVLLYLNSLRQVHASNPIALLHSENLGEKPPRANWLFGVLGFVLLAAAYVFAVSIKNPLQALIGFFIAVIMVIVATYLIFIAGSVLLCKLLQKNKKYYYRADHFVSVSSMSYRMKRNGAGLASICILATMVLVMISSTSCLYFGREGSLAMRYPSDFSAGVQFASLDEATDEHINGVRDALNTVLQDRQTNVIDYRSFDISGVLRDGKLDPNVDDRGGFGYEYDSLLDVTVMSLADYNKMMGTDYTLKDDETILYSNRTAYRFDTIQIADGPVYKVIPGTDDYKFEGNAMASVVDTVCMVVNDMAPVAKPLYDAVNEMREHGGEYYIPFVNWNYFFDVPGLDDEAEIELEFAYGLALGDYLFDTDWNFGYSYGCIASERADFYGLYGGLFFLGILLSIVFICATVLIIYYKQLSEGYEDQSRFEIMQKVGMTKKDIRKSINSQMLTVFALPIVFGVLHFGFAFPLIYKLLQLFAVSDLKLLLITAGITVAVFAVIYAIIYRITSNAYYNIVSE